MSLESLLTRRQIETLRAVTQRMVPSEDGPGAAEAEVMGYIRWVALKPLFRDRAPRLASGLDLLESLAQSRHGCDFTACDPRTQDDVLEALQQVPHPIAQRFLAAVVSLTLAGFLCDPKYGGNRDRVGWKYLGFERRTSPPVEDGG